MLKLVIVALVIQASSHPVESAFRNLVCQTCNSWCCAGQSAVNISEIEDMIDMKIREALLRNEKRHGRNTTNDGDSANSYIDWRPIDIGSVNTTEDAAIRPTNTTEKGGNANTTYHGNNTVITEVAVVTNTTEERGCTCQTQGISETATSKNRKVSATVDSCQITSFELAKSTNETGGVFDMNIPGVGVKEVYCDTRTDLGNWIVFQRRMDGSVDFNRKWNDYANGFGSASGEFWLGLEAVNKLTTNGSYELRIDMVRSDGTHLYAKYRSFYVRSESRNYGIYMTGYSGNATNSFSSHYLESFSTIDRDNDKTGGNCAAFHKSGWWFNDCFDVNLNGPYNGSVVWRKSYFGSQMQMRFTEMKFRRKP